jgi:L-histidine Nalpha-methyltransferase
MSLSQAAVHPGFPAASSASSLLADVLDGLSRPRKRIPSKYFYDEAGSALFDRICELDEYYPTRTELAIMQRHAGEMAELIGENALVVELGSGSSLKTRLLIDHLRQPAAYVPVDISAEHLHRTADELRQSYPDLDIRPLAADYTGDLALDQSDADRTVVYFPGSTIGNFEPGEARRFLTRIRRMVEPDGGLLIGVDLRKNPSVLHAAYNDAEGVTAAFNLNLLARLNRELGADFDLDAFTHDAVYDEAAGRIQMYLISGHRQSVEIAGRVFNFDEGERIHTEDSYKYDPEDFAALAAEAGFVPAGLWIDELRYFSVHYFEPSGDSGP